MFVNGVGAVATGITVLVVLIAKFTEGAWITVLLIPALILLMVLVRRDRDHVIAKVNDGSPLSTQDLAPPIVVVAINQWNLIAQKGLRFAMSMSPNVVAVHVDYGQQCDLEDRWSNLVEEPAGKAGLAVPRLVALKSPYRFVIRPILDYVLELERCNPNRQIAVLIPELVERSWYLKLLHNHRSTVLKALLLFQGKERITVVNVPWYLTA